jgi:hypothetical protein
MNALLKTCLSVYRRLARAYPHEFQMVYGEELELIGEDALPDIWKRQGYRGFYPVPWPGLGSPFEFVSPPHPHPVDAADFLVFFRSSSQSSQSRSRRSSWPAAWIWREPLHSPSSRRMVEG